MDDGVYGALRCRHFGSYVILDMTEPPADGAAAAQTSRDLAELCNRIAWDDQVRVVVFSFDGEMDKVTPLDIASIDATAHVSLSGPVAGLKQPVIAAVRGNALGIGLELALACDIRIGTKNACYGLTQVHNSCIPGDGGTQRLPRLIGQGNAMRMILTGEAIDAEEAVRLGLMNKIVPTEILMQTATELAREMAEKSPLSLIYAKEALYKGLDLTLDQGIKMELDLYLLLFSTTDRTEGVTAFKERRKPRFEGV